MILDLFFYLYIFTGTAYTKILNHILADFFFVLPHVVSMAYKNHKNNKKNVKAMPGEALFQQSTNVKIPFLAVLIPCHVVQDFCFMPFLLEMSCWRILFHACHRTNMVFMTFMNVTSLGTCCLSGRV